MNKIDGSTAGCEIELKSGRACGVTAIGRCATCERAFCLTHQARERVGYGLTPYVDMCASCFATSPKEVERAKHEAKSEKWLEECLAGEKYFMSGAARTDLLTSGVQPTEIYRVGKREMTKRGLFGRRYESIDVSFLFGHGWILGKFPWKYSVKVYQDTKDVKEDCLTALMDLSPDDPSLNCHHTIPHIYTRENSTLVRVQPYSEGYQVLDFTASNCFVGRSARQGWREAAETVKQLTGESS